MNKLPLELTKEDIEKIMNKRVRIISYTELKDSNTVTLEGNVIECGLSIIPPYLPIELTIKTQDGFISKINIFTIKEITQF